MRFPKLPNAGGFSLLEVLVAMAIISIALLALSSTGGGQIKQLNNLQQQTLAHWVAQSVITESRLARADGLGRSEGVSEMGSQHWYWQLHTAPSSDPLLLRLDVSVFSDPEQQQLILAQSGFKLSLQP